MSESCRETDSALVSALDRNAQLTELHQEVSSVVGVIAVKEGLHMEAGIHADRITGASLDTEATEDAPELVDHERGGIFLDRGVVALRRSDVDAVGWADGRATHAGDTTDVAVFAQHQPMLTAVSLGVRPNILRIVVGDVSLVEEPQVLLLDEPTSNLDLKHQLETLDLISEVVKKKGLSAVMAIHDLNLASRFSDKIAMLKDGGIYAAGESGEVFSPENIREVYGVETRVLANDSGKPYIIPLAAVENGFGRLSGEEVGENKHKAVFQRR